MKFFDYAARIVTAIESIAHARLEVAQSDLKLNEVAKKNHDAGMRANIISTKRIQLLMNEDEKEFNHRAAMRIMEQELTQLRLEEARSFVNQTTQRMAAIAKVASGTNEKEK